MKNRLFLFIAVAVATACVDTTPTQPEGDLPSSPVQMSAASATTVPFAALVVFSYPISMGVQEVTGKVMHWTGAEFAWTVSGDLTGMFAATGEWLYHRDGQATGHGKWVMELTAPCEGTFEGNWHGILDPAFKGTMVGQGIAGCKGMTMKADFAPVSDNNYVQNFYGTLHYSNAQD
jgi:hypothetical protein